MPKGGDSRIWSILLGSRCRNSRTDLPQTTRVISWRIDLAVPNSSGVRILAWTIEWIAGTNSGQERIFVHIAANLFDVGLCQSEC